MTLAEPALHYVGGAWIDGNDTLVSTDPATGEALGVAALGSTEAAEAAIVAARAAFEHTTWTSEPRLRAGVLDAFADGLAARADDLATLLVRENGKVLAQARHEVVAAASEARYYAGLARNIFGRTLESGTGKLSLLNREPAGVASVIVPWNAPITLLVRSVAPALAAGCTVVIKPAPQTPLVHAEVIRCFAEIDELPAGVVNSVNENGIEVGTVLSTHDDIDVVSFTGSSATGKVIMANAARTVKRVSLELGGKAPAVVFADADVDKAIAEIRRSAIVLTGQMCTAVSRVLVDRSAADTVTERLTAAFESVRVGHGLDANSEMGPLIDKANQDRVMALIARAADEADIVLRGTAPGHNEHGAFVTPTLFRINDTSHPLVQDELFAPMVSVETFDDEAEAIAKSNATRFGLAASVYTQDLNRAVRVSRALRFGSVWLNSHNRLFAEAETGGYRQSGVGRLHGVEGLNDFLETKHVYLETAQ